MNQAYVLVADEILPEIIGVLADDSIRMISADRWDEKVVRLLIEGDVLPDSMNGGAPLVTIEVHTERHGRQKIDRIATIERAE